MRSKRSSGHSCSVVRFTRCFAPFVLAVVWLVGRADVGSAGQAHSSGPHSNNAAAAQAKVAKVVGDGALVGWKGLFWLTPQQTGGTVVLFDCDTPLLNAKLKKAGCQITPRTSTPFVVGADGTLQGWQVTLAGSGSHALKCADPTLSFSDRSISCPQTQNGSVQLETDEESEIAQLKSQLATAQAELLRLKTPAPSTVPFTVTVAQPSVHSFACEAPILDLEARILTCFDAKWGF